ncbi:hypothetical protein JCM10450v2_002110 [Rhodotorula kratochvilovae]
MTARPTATEGHGGDALRSYLATIPEYSTQRIQFYYSSLPSRKHSNPTGYSSALQWWRKTLRDLVQKGLLSDDKLSLHVDDALREHLRWDAAGRPTSLGVIIARTPFCPAELAQTSDLVPSETYLSSAAPESYGIASLLARPFWWGLSKVWGGGGVDLGEHADEKEWARRKGDYVVPDLVEKAATALLPQLADLHPTALTRLYTLRTLRDKLGALCLPDVTLSENDCRVLATYLARKGECAFDGEVIKFPAPHAARSPLTITESDRSSLTLAASLASLTHSITSLTTLIASERASASAALAEKRPIALVKAHLAARRRAEKLLEERVNQRAKVEEVVWAIERAKGDEETLSALSLGATTLRAVLSSPTLQLSNIAATTSALDDALIRSAEVGEAVDAVSAGQLGEGEEEVEEELREMQEAERRAERERGEARVKEAEEKMLEGAKVPAGEAGAKEGAKEGKGEKDGEKEKREALPA